MASKHEMICTEASIPIRILGRNNIHIINDRLFYGTQIMGVTDIDKPNQHCHTEGEEKGEPFQDLWFGSGYPSPSCEWEFPSMEYMLLQGPL